jgi:hypothetical protein
MHIAKRGLSYWSTTTHAWTLALGARALMVGSSSRDIRLTVANATAPALTVPADLTVNATGPDGAVVTFTTSAVGVAGIAVTTVCTPASGSTFPIGLTTVSCTATDAAGNAVTKTFTVLVKGAAAQLADLSALLDAFNLANGKSAKFENTLDNVSKHLASGQTKQVCQELDAFVKKAQQEAGKSLTADQSAQLVTAARRIQAVVGC